MVGKLTNIYIIQAGEDQWLGTQLRIKKPAGWLSLGGYHCSSRHHMLLSRPPDKSTRVDWSGLDKSENKHARCGKFWGSKSAITAHGLEAWFGKMDISVDSNATIDRKRLQNLFYPPAIKHGSNSPIFIHLFMRLHWKIGIFYLCIIDYHLFSKLQRFSQPFLLVKPPRFQSKQNMSMINSKIPFFFMVMGDFMGNSMVNH